MSRQVNTCSTCGKLLNVFDTDFGCENDLEFKERVATICQCEESE